MTAERLADVEGDATPKIHPRNGLNDLDGERFLYFTKSVLATSYPRVYSHDIRKRHGANKPPQLMAQLIEFFTKSDMLVLDPFAGVGGTLIGASIAAPGPRRCVGIEISAEWAALYDSVAGEHPDLVPQTMIVGECREVMDQWLAGKAIALRDGTTTPVLGGGPFDFILADPPYNIHLDQTMSGAAARRYEDVHPNRRSDYNMRSSSAADLANLSTYDEYLGAMEEVFARCYRLLRPGRYMVVIVRDAYQNGEYVFTHVDLARRAREVGFKPKGEIVWHQAGTRLRPYGYPYGFVPNIIHQNIVILQRPRDA